jgi:sugar-specific transcriptional regulator TrmB
MKIHDYLEDLWFTKKEGDIYLALYRLWSQPASVISKYVWFERTYTYKVLLEFWDKNLLSVTEKNWIKHFFIPDISILKKYLQKQKERYGKMENDFHMIETELVQYDSRMASKLPKINIYDWSDSISNLYDDIFDQIISKWYISIKMFASNTIMSQTWINENKASKTKIFFDKLIERKIHVETFLGNWLWIMESLWKTENINELANLPAANSSIQIFIVWKIVYILIFKDIPYWMKFDSEDLARALHFLFENLKVN